MKKSLKILIGIIICLVICWVTIFVIDYMMVLRCKEPIFIIASNNVDDSGSGTYKGLGYTVEMEMKLSTEYGKQISKIEMYIFNKFIAGGIVDFNNDGLNQNEIKVSNSEDENSFRAIVKKSNLSYIEVEPIEKNDKKLLSDRVRINLEENNDMLYMEEQELLITHTGIVRETYPTQIDVIDIKTETQYKTKIEDLPKDYTVIEAITDKCFVTPNNNKIYNKDELDRFVNNIRNNKVDFIRWISYTTEGDMIITDINFEGNNSFRITKDWTRDQFSSKNDRIIKKYRFSSIEIDENEEYFSLIPSGLIEGENANFLLCYYRKNAEVINNYEFNYNLDIVTHNEEKAIILTTNELAQKYDYDIYYTRIESATIKINGKDVDLKEALKNDLVTMELIIEQAEKDSNAGIIGSDMIKDGGSMVYFYPNYIIKKCNTLNGNKDVYIIAQEKLED